MKKYKYVSSQIWIVAALTFGLLLVGCGDDTAPASTVAPNTTPESARATDTPLPVATSVKASIPAVTSGDSRKPLNSPLNSPIQAQTVGGDVSPKQRSVWNTTVGTDNMTGDCKASVLPAYGLVQITPNLAAKSLTWKNQEPEPYTLQASAPNQFQYSGPTVTKDGTVTMTVTFTDDKNFSMTRDFVATNAPGCNHHHDYVGVFQWNK